MLRVRSASGPASAQVGDQVTYTVTSFSETAPRPRDTAKVSWLIKSAGGDALGQFTNIGPELQLAVPDTWAGETAIVMPFMRSPSTNVSVRTAIAARVSPPAGAARHVDVTRDGPRFYASVDGEPAFYVGTRVRYQERRGLTNVTSPPGSRYRPEDYEGAHGHWAWYLWPTITSESRGFFTCLNTYDSARFTFGHIQLAAHTPDDNFVLLFRALLALPSAAEYFPDLALGSSGRVDEVAEDGSSTPIETAETTNRLMRYFNATPHDVDSLEAERAARMVDWCRRHADARDLQVAVAVRQQQRKFKTHARRLSLDGAVDKLCLVVLDILHQGRARYTTISAALQSANPFDALLGIGASAYPERIATLRAGIRDLEAQGRVGEKVYDLRAGDFVTPGQA